MAWAALPARVPAGGGAAPPLSVSLELEHDAIAAYAPVYAFVTIRNTSGTPVELPPQHLAAVRVLCASDADDYRECDVVPDPPGVLKGDVLPAGGEVRGHRLLFYAPRAPGPNGAERSFPFVRPGTYRLKARLSLPKGAAESGVLRVTVVATEAPAELVRLATRPSIARALQCMGPTENELAAVKQLAAGTADWAPVDHARYAIALHHASRYRGTGKDADGLAAYGAFTSVSGRSAMLKVLARLEQATLVLRSHAVAEQHEDELDELMRGLEEGAATARRAGLGGVAAARAGELAALVAVRRGDVVGLVRQFAGREDGLEKLEIALRQVAAVDDARGAALRELCGSADGRERVYAAYALHRLNKAAPGPAGDPEAAPVRIIAKAAEAADEGLALVAVRALGWVGPTAAGEVPVLVAHLSAKDTRLREAAVEALANFGAAAAAALPDLAALADHPEDTTRSRVAAALGSVGGASPHAVPPLVRLLKDPSGTVRHVAAMSLRQLGPYATDALEPLIGALRDPEANVRMCAASALSGIGPNARGAVPALKAAARDPNTSVQEAVERALKELDR
jgi:HEAT repeat protein